MKWFIWILISAALLAVYYAGPKPAKPELPDAIRVPDISLRQLEADLSAREDTVPGLKDDNQARIEWYDTPYQKTPYVVVYLHGWSASYKEGDPVHRKLAARYGANLYLPRLYGHGVERGDENFSNITATNLMRSAAEAVGEAHLLGDSIIVVGTSTGGTLGIYLAGIDPKISTLVLYSPNIRIYDPSAFLLDDPWGVQVAKLVTGSDFYDWDATGDRAQYWTAHYQIRALGELESLVENTMRPEIYARVHQPTFVGYYYKNDSLHDRTVSVDAIREMFPRLGTARKELVAFPEAGHHVIGSSLTSGDLNSVWQETISFLDSEGGLIPSEGLMDSVMVKAILRD